MIKLANKLLGEDNMKSIIVFLAAMAMAHSGFAAEPADAKKEPAKTAKAKPAAATPTPTPGVVKIEKKEPKATEEKLPKPKVKRPDELAAEKAKK